MAEPNIANQGFSKLFDTQHDSNVFDGLVSSGILPKGFRVIVGSVDLTGTAAGEEAIVVDASGNQIFIEDGRQIVMASAVATTAVTGTAGWILTLGLAPDSGADVNQGSTIVVASANTSEFQNTAPVVVLDNNNWLSVNVTIQTTTAGVLQVVLIVV